MSTMTPPTLRVRQQEATRAEIVNAALDLFEEHGYRRTTIEDIAARVGMSARTVFRHFPNKHALVLGWMPTIEAILVDLPLSGDSPAGVLNQLEDGLEEALIGYGELINSGSAASFARFRHLMNTDPDLRAATSVWVERFFALARTRLGEQLADDVDNLTVPLLIQLAAVPATAALDAWAHSLDGDLVSLYREARRRRAEILQS